LISLEIEFISERGNTYDSLIHAWNLDCALSIIELFTL